VRYLADFDRYQCLVLCSWYWAWIFAGSGGKSTGLDITFTM